MTQKAKTTISLSYKGNLDDETASRFSEVQEALEGLASSEGIWRLPVSSKPPKAGEVAPSPEREPARVGLLPTPGIKADVPIWGIEAGDGTIFFFPEGTLLYRNDRYEPVPYKALKITFSSGRFFEEDDLPADATVVDSTWRFSRPDGSPDPRYKNDNVEIPVVLYSLLDINGPSGLKMRLMVSNRRAAARFARTFGAEDLREKRRKDSTAGAASGKASGRSSSNGQKGREESVPFRGGPGEGGQARHGEEDPRRREGGIGGGDQRRLQGAGAHPPPRQGGQPGAGSKRVFGAEDEGDQLCLRGSQAPME